MAPYPETKGDWMPQSTVARAISVRVFVSLAAAISLLCLGGSVFFFLHSTRSDGLTSQIEAQLDELGVKPGTVELTSQKALRVRHAIAAGDFATANQISADVYAQSRIQTWRFDPFESFIAAVFVATPPEFARRLDEWVAKDATSALPLLFRAQYSYNVGWDKRGHDFSNETSPERVAVFADDMKKALADVNAAIHADADNPYSLYLKLRILQGSGLSQAFAAAFADGIAKFPAYYPLYEIALSTLQPRWGGSIPAMYAFVEKYAGNAPQFAPLKLLYLSLYRHLLSTASVECNASGGDRDKTTRCVVAFMQQAIAPGLEQNALDALQLYDHTDKYEFGLMAKDIISDMLATTDADTYSGAILQLAATSMHSDTQLKERHPSHNDYIVDELVAESWQNKGFYANAMAKYKEALADAGQAMFPREEDKNNALALIYERLSEAAAQQHQYLDEIVYEKAAVLLGLKWDEHYICHGYYELKHYDEAVQACTDAIQSTDNSFAWYWRGEAYDQSGREGQALVDLTKSADLDDYFSPSAAIAATMIYFNRNDNQNALDILNKYTFLYDPNRTDKSLVAVAYNNRCYAYMQLGDLKKALDDCTQSLKYGSIPDAFRKQQELVKRLAAPEKRS
jgi:tetratricopeptide (TPR) repeat protein